MGFFLERGFMKWVFYFQIITKTKTFLNVEPLLKVIIGGKSIYIAHNSSYIVLQNISNWI